MNDPRPAAPSPSDTVLTHARAIVFATSFCMMVIELVASRVIAPHLGVSIYTWTSVIGTILAGMTVGNYVGGLWADRGNSRARLGTCIALSGAVALFITFLAPLLGNTLAGSSFILWESTLIFSIVLFFPAAFLLATVSPQVMRFQVKSVEGAGRAIGSISAWAALGSIFGTFLTGFLLISYFGTRILLMLVALFLLGLGAMIGREAKIWKHRASGLVALLILGDLVTPGACKMETNYYCIRVTEKVQTTGNAFVLKLDHLVHSYVYPAEPDLLGYGYEKVYANLIAMNEPDTNAAFKTLFIGGGGYTLPRYLERFYPNADVTVSEIDPGVTVANHRFMELSDQTRIKSVDMDARMYLQDVDREKKFDLVFGDAFNDFSVPYHLTTEEFHRLLKARMTPNGVYALNIIDDPRHGRFLAAMVRTLRSVWKNVYIGPQARQLENHRSTFVLIASDAPIDRSAWDATSPPHGPGYDRQADTENPDATYLLTIAQVEDFLRTHPTPKLTDDFVPTDVYLAPVFRDAY